MEATKRVEDTERDQACSRRGRDGKRDVLGHAATGAEAVGEHRNRGERSCKAERFPPTEQQSEEDEGAENEQIPHRQIAPREPERETGPEERHDPATLKSPPPVQSRAPAPRTAARSTSSSGAFATPASDAGSHTVRHLSVKELDVASTLRSVCSRQVTGRDGSARSLRPPSRIGRVKMTS